MEQADGTPALIFFGVNVALILALASFLRLREFSRKWRKRRAKVRHYDKSAVRIDDLYQTYRLMIAGRTLIAGDIDRQVQLHYSWVKQERPLLPDDDLDRLFPIQDKLIEVLEYATERNPRSQLAPAEFRDMVEGRRRQPLLKGGPSV